MKILGIDYPCMDMGVACRRIPEDGGLEPITELTMQCGGKIPNALAAAARLGAEAGLIGVCGSDRYGEKCRRDLEYNGVSTSRLRARPGRTGLCICIADAEEGGKRCIESPAGFSRLCPEELEEAELAGADMLLLYEMDETAVRAAEIVRRHGGRVLADGDEYDARTQDHLNLIDILIVSEYYYRHLFGESEDYEANLRSLQAKGPDTVIVTLGGRGCAGVDSEGFFREPAFTHVHVVDTTGAGDVFHGAYAYFTLSGLTAKEAAVRASAVSAIKCTRLGGRTGLPTLRGVQSFLRTGTVEPEDFEERSDYYHNMAFE